MRGYRGCALNEVYLPQANGDSSPYHDSSRSA